MGSFDWQEPTDKSPVPVPRNWEGGGLEAVGGGSDARIWRHKHSDVRVIYENYDRRVSLQEWTPDGYELLSSSKADYFSDISLAHEAVEMMESVNATTEPRDGRPNDVGSDTGFVFGDSFGFGDNELGL